MLPDYLAVNLDIVFVGINPGEYSDRVGHYFARPQNQFWSALNGSGLVREKLTAQDDHRLLGFGLGLTDIVARATPNSSHLRREEFSEGMQTLRTKLEPLRPRIACFVGLMGFRAGLDLHAKLGEQAMRWNEIRLFIVPSTSPRNAYYRPQTAEWFKRLKEFRDTLKSDTIR